MHGGNMAKAKSVDGALFSQNQIVGKKNFIENL